MQTNRPKTALVSPCSQFGLPLCSVDAALGLLFECIGGTESRAAGQLGASLASLFSLTLSDIHAWLTDLHSYVDKASEVSHWSNPSLSQVNRPKHTHAHCHRRICDVCLQAQWSDCILIAGISPRAGGSKTRSRGIWLRKIRVTPSCLYRFGGGGTLILRSQILRTRVLDSPPVGNSCYQFAHVKHRLVELPPSAEVFTDLCSLKLPRKPMPAHSGGVGVLHLVELKGQTAALLASQSGPLFH